MGNQDTRPTRDMGHPAVTYDEYGRPVYDTASEPEAAGRRYEQPLSIAGGAHMAEATAAGTSTPRVLTSEWGSHDDLLTGAPTDGGDAPGSPDEDD